MSQHDDRDPQLYEALDGAFAGEPPMESVPGDDLARGHRLRRRRRAGATVAAAAAVSVIAVLGAGLVGAVGPSASDGSPGFADGGGATSAEAEQDASQTDCTVVSESGSSGSAAGAVSGPQGQPVELDRSDVDTAECGVPVGPGDEYVVEDDITPRLEEALTSVLDPDGSHVRSMISGMGSSSVALDPEPGDGSDGLEGQGDETGTNGTDEFDVSAAGVSGEWLDGDGRGGMALTVATADEAVHAGCSDPMADETPTMTCEPVTLDDGTSVVVGRGGAEGARVLTVRYERPDGQVVFASATQALRVLDGDRAEGQALSELPATVEQLAELAQDSRAHL